MIKLENMSNSLWTIKGIFEKETKNKEFIIKKQNVITDDIANKVAYIFLGKETEFKTKNLKEVALAIINYGRKVQVDVSSIVTKQVTETQVIRMITEAYEFKNGVLWTAKTKKPDKVLDLMLVKTTAKSKTIFNEALVLEQARTYARSLQIMSPNILNSETYADLIKKDFEKSSNIKLSILNKKQIAANKMELFLAVNKGSAYEPRIVVLEYKGNPSSKDVIAIVGKGITFDAGGYNIKIGKGMNGMKYDMSGSAIVAGLFKAISELKPKSNLTGVLMLTDNVINSIAATPDSVWTAMNGKTVEITDIDAEGRLVLADGLTYAAKKLGATKLIDIATLTGTMNLMLGHIYSGVWATNDKDFESLQEAANLCNELIWRMPLHEEFAKLNHDSKVADLKNCDLSWTAVSSTAAAFLNEFTEGKELIHIDIAETACVNGEPAAPLLKTLFELSKR